MTKTPFTRFQLLLRCQPELGAQLVVEMGVNRSTVWRWAAGSSFPGRERLPKLLQVLAKFRLESNDVYQSIEVQLPLDVTPGVAA